MTAWRVLFEKECLELKRNFKWLWVPLVFLLLGISDPITSYLMPDILEAAGSLPEGAILQIPIPAPMEVLGKTLSNFGTVGLLVLVLSFMSTVSGERQRGVTGMIMVKPVSHLAYLSSKWTAALLLAWGSILLGYAGSWYYTVLLIGPVDPGNAVAAFLLYGVWFTLLLTLTLLLNTWLSSGGAAAAVTLLAAVLLSISTGLLDKWMLWSPARLTSHAGELLQKGQVLSSFPLSLMVSLLSILAALLGAVLLFKKKEIKPM